MVGGFDFNKNKFNHVTQAWRQPGSGFKPFIYSAALEKGFTPGHHRQRRAAVLRRRRHRRPALGAEELRRQVRGPDAAAHRAGQVQEHGVHPHPAGRGHPERAGLDHPLRLRAEKHPAYLTMALGAGSVTPMQMATGYAVFANGGYRVNPWLITPHHRPQGQGAGRDPAAAAHRGHARRRRPQCLRHGPVAERSGPLGTAASASAHLKRTDLYGKTGTTNDSIDTWFNGFHPSVVAIVWMGYDNPRPLGDRETGGSMSLPVWINFMETALKGVPVTAPTAPEGVVNIGGEWFYDEYSRGGGVSSLGVTPVPQGEPLPISGTPAGTPARAGSPPLGPAMSPAPDGNSPPSPPRPAEERRSILDLFRN
jgi:penicillin-binding protein 1A